MLPHNHFLIAGLVITPVAIIWFPEVSIMGVGKWVLIGGLLSAAIDLDVIALVQLKSKDESRLKPFTNPSAVFQKFDLFMDTINETGVLRIALKTHLIFSTVIILVFYLISSQYFIPVTLGVVSHLLSDIPNLRRVIK